MHDMFQNFITYTCKQNWLLIEGFDRSPFLNRVSQWLVSKLVGWNQEENNSLRQWEISAAISFSSLAGTSSGPWDFVGSK